MGTNDLKGNSESKTSYENAIFEKIERILDGKISKSELDSLSQKNGFKSTIDEILNKYSNTKKLAIYVISEIDLDFFIKHKDLHNDLDIVKLAIGKKSNLFYSITSDLIKNKEIGEIMIKSMIRENLNFYEIESFINTYYPKNTEKLFNFYFKYLNKASDYLLNDLSKNLFNLKQSNLSLYTQLNTCKLFIAKGKNIIINDVFIKQFLLEIDKDESYELLNQEEKDIYIINKLSVFFGTNYSKMGSEEKNIFDLVLNLINIGVSKQIKKNIKKEQDESQLGVSTSSLDEEISELDTEDEFDDFADFAYPECNSISVSGGYNIETITGNKIFISDNEKDKFTTKALKNYIKFHNTLRNLGLNFLWDKYSYDFKVLCNNKFGFNYMIGEGITDSKMLSVLNMIGRNIGIPEHTVLDEKGKETNKVKCFKTIGDAREAFNEIKETGIINGKKYSDQSTFGNGAVEKKLIEVLCIDQKGNGLNISKWR